MGDMPKQPQSQSFFNAGSPSGGYIVYVVAKQVQSESEFLQILLVLDISLMMARFSIRSHARMKLDHIHKLKNICYSPNHALDDTTNPGDNTRNGLHRR